MREVQISCPDCRKVSVVRVYGGGGHWCRFCGSDDVLVKPIKDVPVAPGRL